MDPKETKLQNILERENLDLEGFLIQGTSGGVESLSWEELNRMQQLYLWKTQEKGSKKEKKRNRMRNAGVKKIKSTLRLAPKNPREKRGRKKKNELLMECGKLMIDSGKMKDLTSYSFTNL